MTTSAGTITPPATMGDVGVINATTLAGAPCARGRGVFIGADDGLYRLVGWDRRI